MGDNNIGISAPEMKHFRSPINTQLNVCARAAEELAQCRDLLRVYMERKFGPSTESSNQQPDLAAGPSPALKSHNLNAEGWP
jgi:hypothetical protein